jgi:competence protein ComEC
MRLVFIGLLGGFYTLMVGAEPPYMRAYFGAMSLSASFLLGREVGSFQAMVVSAWAILLCEPRALFSLGFQMTYLAIVGLVVAMPTLNRAIPYGWSRWLRIPVAALGVTVIVEMMLWPLFASTFGRGSLAGALSNVLLVPASGLMMAGGFSLWGVSWLTQGPWLELWAQGVKGMIVLFAEVCYFASSWLWAAVELSPMSVPGLVSYYLAVFAILFVARRRICLSLAAVAFLVWGSGALAVWLSAPSVRVIYLSIPSARQFSSPKSHAAILSFPGGRHWLAAGVGSWGTARKALKAYRIGSLEKVVILQEGGGLRGLKRLLSYIPVGTVEYPRSQNFQFCKGRVCFEFDPPRVRRGSGEFSIIPSRLRFQALEVETDGFKVEIRNTGS